MISRIMGFSRDMVTFQGQAYGLGVLSRQGRGHGGLVKQREDFGDVPQVKGKIMVVFFLVEKVARVTTDQAVNLRRVQSSIPDVEWDGPQSYDGCHLRVDHGDVHAGEGHVEFPEEDNGGFQRRGEAEVRTVGMERSLHDTKGTLGPTSIKFHCRLRASEGDNKATWKNMLLQKPMFQCANFFCR